MPTPDPNSPSVHTITVGQLADALQLWEFEAKANGWPARDDPDRFVENAEYLLGLIARPAPAVAA